MNALQAPLPDPRTGKQTPDSGAAARQRWGGSPAAADVPAQVGSFQLAPVRILGTDQRVVTVPNSRCEPMVNLTPREVRTDGVWVSVLLARLLARLVARLGRGGIPLASSTG